MTTYATFTENNQWEGETWRFHIPIEGNEQSLNRLLAALTSGVGPAQPASYRLSLEPVDEATVDDRVALGGGDYMHEDNKLSGRLVLPDDLLGAIVNDDLLYKGGVKDLMEAP
jgi:hypothetical protein